MEIPTSPYRRGAAAGKRFGIYMSLVFVFMVLSSTSALASMAAMAIAIALPIILYRTLRRSQAALDYRCTFGEMWAEGISTIFFGALICSLVTMAYLLWIEPGFLTARVQECIDMLRQSDPEANRAMIATLTEMVEKNAVPTASQFVLSMFWFTITSGAVLSLIVAAIARISGRPRPKCGRITPTWPGK